MSKRSLHVIASAFLILILIFGSSGCVELVRSPVKQSHKITVCHKGRKTLVVSGNALKAHLRHGDYRGRCRY